MEISSRQRQTFNTHSKGNVMKDDINHNFKTDQYWISSNSFKTFKIKITKERSLWNYITKFTFYEKELTKDYERGGIWYKINRKLSIYNAIYNKLFEKSCELKKF